MENGRALAALESGEGGGICETPHDSGNRPLGNFEEKDFQNSRNGIYWQIRMKGGGESIMRRLLGCGALVLLGCLAANASTVVVDFSTVPLLPTGPSYFGQAGPMQTIVVPGIATFTGGVVLGNEHGLFVTLLTPPNVYATSGFGDALDSTMTITINPSFLVTEVAFPLYNAATTVESYVVDAYDGTTLVASQTLSDIPGTVQKGTGNVDLIAPGSTDITSVTITPTALNAPCCDGWDYSIATVTLTGTLLVPEPATFGLLGLGLSFAYLWRRRRA